MKPGMPLEVRIWRSFSANNSSSHYLVARFAGPRQAQRCAAELSQYLAANEAELDAMSLKERRANRELTLANLEFAEQLGFSWPAHIVEGFADRADLELAALGRDLVVYHDYCLGFDDALTRYVEARDGRVSSERWNTSPTVSILVFATSPPSERLADELVTLFAGNLEASFRAATASGFAAAVGLDQFEALQALLDAHPDADLEVAVDRPDNVRRFRLIDQTRCLGCDNAALDFLPADRAKVPGDQLACHRCGAMFALDSLVDALEEE